MLERPQEALEALLRAVELAGVASAVVAARMKRLRLWLSTDERPPLAPAVPAPAREPTSAFKFKPAPTPSAAPQVSSWVHQGRPADVLSAEMASLLPDEDALRTQLNLARSCGVPCAATFAVALAQAALKAGTTEAWSLLGAPLAAATPSVQHRQAAGKALEAFRAQHTPGEAMPLPRDVASLVLACGCVGESPALRRAAFESANALFLQAARSPGGASVPLFEHPDVEALLAANLPAACLAACAPSCPQAVREAAAGTFHNLCAHALRLWGQGAQAGADATYERLCLALDREGLNPLDADASDDEWDEAAAHAFLAPVAALLDDSGSRALLSALSLQKLRVNALHAVQRAAGGEAAARGVVTVLALLERVAESGGAGDALRPLAGRIKAAAFQREVDARLDAFGNMAAALEMDLRLPAAEGK